MEEDDSSEEEEVKQEEEMKDEQEGNEGLTAKIPQLIL